MRQTVLPSNWPLDSTFQALLFHLRDSRVCFSSVFHEQGLSRRVLLKGEYCPYLQRDWYAYSLMRASCDAICITGKIMQAEPGCLLHLPSDPLLASLYSLNPKIKVAVLTRSLSRECVQKQVNAQMYEVVECPEGDVLGQLRERYGRVLAEWGPTVFRQYLEGIARGEPKTIDTLLITSYKGVVDEKCRGEELNPLLYKMYELKYRSEEEEVGGGVEGKLSFEIWKAKL